MKVDFKNARFPVISDVCWIEAGYTGTQEIANIYLGGRQVAQKAVVKLQATFDTDTEVADFMTVWHNDIDEGVKTFIIDATIFGKTDMYGIEQISPIVHNVQKGINRLTLTAKVLFDSSSVNNHVPIVENMTVHLEENSRDNFIILKGHDQDKELIDFQVGVGTAFGTLIGTPPNLLYTPDPSFQGIDCFNYTGSDYWGKSKDGIVTIIVDDSLKPDSIFEYVVNNPIRAVGNIHYDLGDGIWARSNGGLLVPKNGDTIKIASLDHIIDTRDTQHVLSVNVLKWGQRTDYENFISNMANLSSFSVDPHAGVCMAQTLKNFATSTPIKTIPMFQTKTVTDWTEAFMNTKVHNVPAFDFTSATTLYRAFRASSVAFLDVMNTSGCVNFSEMLMDTTKFSCLGGIDTTGSVNNYNMFNNCAGTRPTPAERTNIVGGYLFKQSGGCGFTVAGVTETSAATCHVTKPGTACTATGKYKAVVTNMPASGGLTYKWTSSTHGAVLTNGTTDEVTVKMPINARELDIELTCEIKSTSATKSVSGIFKVKQTYDALIIDLPKSYGRINLKDFIAANNPTNLVEVVLSNRVVNCAIETGDLTGINVKLINYSEIQGFRDGNKDALTVTSALILDNQGIIRGAGKTGDRGANGKDDKYNKKVYTEKYTKAHCGTGGVNESNWHDIAGDPAGLHAIIHWEGKRQTVRTSKTTGIAIAGETGTFRRGKYQTKIACNYINTVYGIIHETTTPTPRKGGIGGLGGLGQGYTKKPTKGEAGSPSKPSGGNSGKTGADGGLWGTGGNAIKGKSHLDAKSKTGTVQGAIV